LSYPGIVATMERYFTEADEVEWWVNGERMSM